MSESDDLNQPEPVEAPNGPFTMPEPAHIELLEEQSEDRVLLNGSQVVASRTVLMRHLDVVAIKPFPRSKTGPTIEFQCQTGSKSRNERHDNPQTRTTRFVLHHWTDDGASTPFVIATYRGKQIMGMIHLRKPTASIPMWSLTYTLFYPFKAGRQTEH